MSTMLLLGTANVCWYGTKFITCAMMKFFNHFQNIGNSKKYLKSSFTEQKTRQQESYSAVIYGASTKQGKAYAHFLAKKGFTLILIEREQTHLDHLAVNL